MRCVLDTEGGCYLRGGSREGASIAVRATASPLLRGGSGKASHAHLSGVGGAHPLSPHSLTHLLRAVGCSAKSVGCARKHRHI
eukprot:1184445-Prorocentrum_minimum.AAC.5